MLIDGATGITSQKIDFAEITRQVNDATKAAFENGTLKIDRKNFETRDGAAYVNKNGIARYEPRPDAMKTGFTSGGNRVFAPQEDGLVIGLTGPHAYTDAESLNHLKQDSISQFVNIMMDKQPLLRPIEACTDNTPNPVIIDNPEREVTVHFPLLQKNEAGSELKQYFLLAEGPLSVDMSGSYRPKEFYTPQINLEITVADPCAPITIESASCDFLRHDMGRHDSKSRMMSSHLLLDDQKNVSGFKHSDRSGYIVTHLKPGQKLILTDPGDTEIRNDGIYMQNAEMRLTITGGENGRDAAERLIREYDAFNEAHPLQKVEPSVEREPPFLPAPLTPFAPAKQHIQVP